MGEISQKKTVFFGKPVPNLFTHPRVFVRFGKTKGEIWVEKGDFRGDLGGFGGVWTLFGNKPPHPPTFGRDLPKKTFFFLAAPLTTMMEVIIVIMILVLDRFS